MKSNHKKNKSMFLHLVIVFMLVGLLPLAIIGSIFVKQYSDDMNDMVISNAQSQTMFISKNLESMLSNLDHIATYLYDYHSEDYNHFYDILQDNKLSSGQLKDKIETVLNAMLYMDNDIKGVRFIDRNNRLTCVYREPAKNIYGKVMLERQLNLAKMEQYKQLQFLPTFMEKELYYPSEDYMFTLARYYMNTATVTTTNHSALGSIYLDIDINEIEAIVKNIQLYKGSKIFILDKNSGAFVYSSNEEDYGKYFKFTQSINENSEKNYIKIDDSILVYHYIENSHLIVVNKILVQDIYEAYKANVTYFSVILIVVSIFLIVVNLLSSRNISKPARELKNVMQEIEKGNLDIRISHINQDEMGFLAEGLNHMVDNLQKYINKVYIAELKQKEAKLEALENQISPHYLYNTLDVIRMTALANQDNKTAQMLDSLSSQLQYLIGQNGDIVPLERELQNIQEYFVIVKVRYVNLLELEINVNKEDQKLYVMKLLLQPIVENCVKHGFQNKREAGRIQIKAARKETYLEVIVMDDGAGISEQKLIEINELLHSDRIGSQTKQGWEHIGLKNVYDRIKKYYGEEYGFEITSCENLGTMVKYRLPVIMENKET